MSDRFPISKDVGRTGATISAPNGFKLIIPANTWPNVVNVQIAGPLFKPTYLSNILIASYAYIISPQTQELYQEATIYIPFDRSFDNVVSVLNIYHSNDAGGVDPTMWQPIPLVNSGIEGVLAGKVSSFGAFFVGYEP